MASNHCLSTRALYKLSSALHNFSSVVLFGIGLAESDLTSAAYFLDQNCFLRCKFKSLKQEIPVFSCIKIVGLCLPRVQFIGFFWLVVFDMV